MPAPIDLEWTLKPLDSPACLVVEYRLTHRGGEQSFLIVDRMIGFARGAGLELQPDELIVLADKEEPELVVLSRGYISPPYSNVLMELIPAVRKLAPGTSLTGRAEVPLPLQERHPNEPLEPLPTTPTKARLEIGVVPGDCALQTISLADGSTVEAPQFGEAFERQTFLRSDVRPLPGRGPR